MAGTGTSRTGAIAVLLALIGSAVALSNEIVRSRRTGAAEWAHVALAFAVPVLIYAIVRSASQRRQ